MASGTRDLLIRLLGDASGMKKALDDADGAVGKHDLNLRGLATTIGAVYSTKQIVDFGRESIQAAADDEASQVQLQTALRNTVGASDEAVASVEGFIEKMMFATGTTDDVLRPAFARLVTSTKDVKEAQDLMGLAMDLSVGKGISLEASAGAIAKAHDGQTAALKRMGVETTDAEGKTLSFDQVVKNLSDTFGGQAAAAAETQNGKLEIMKARFGELQEQVGTALMPVMDQLVGVLSGVAEWFGSLDESTQTWIIRIGMLGGGLLIAAKAVTGIITPLKQLGILGKSADGSTGGLVGKLGDLAAKLPLATAALGGAALAAYAYKDALDNDAEAAEYAAAAIEKFTRATTLKDLQAAFDEWSWDIIAQGKHVSNNFDDMARSNIVAAQTLLDSGIVAQKSEEWQKALADAIKLVEKENKAAAEATEKYGEKVTDTGTKTGLFTDMMKNALDPVNALKAAEEHHKEALDESKDATDRAKEATERAKEAAEKREKALRDEISALEDSRDANREQSDALRAAADSTFAVQAAGDNYVEMLQGLEEEVAAAQGDQEKLNAVYRDGVTDSTNLADALVRQKEDQATANGTTVTAKEKQDAWNASMLASATSANGPLRDAILAYIANANGIPAEKVTEIKALIDEGKIDEANVALADVSRSRDAAIKADIDQASIDDAERRLKALTIGRDVFLTVKTKVAPAPISLFDEGGIVPGQRGSPQLILAHGGETILPTHKNSFAPVGGVGVGGGVTIVQNINAGTIIAERDLARRLWDVTQDALRRGELVGSLG